MSESVEAASSRMGTGSSRERGKGEERLEVRLEVFKLSCSSRKKPWERKYEWGDYRKISLWSLFSAFSAFSVFSVVLSLFSLFSILGCRGWRFGCGLRERRVGVGLGFPSPRLSGREGREEVELVRYERLRDVAETWGSSRSPMRIPKGCR